ncbi:hypothetical protein PLICRDRAFT_105309 [Plicaturopsis crispa FD-325 SS-3]|nr:hypothetical protein PLICRDRAFT_105309 [Plicaturopsis crispa FD-325 SS-3]
MLRMDIRTRYKAMTRKRWSLIGSLSALVDGEQPGDPASALRLVEQLADMSNQLDQLAEELHSVTDQIAQLKSLRDVHSASALAMALRKLNSSFLSKATENNLLRERISALEAERDQAWKQAEDVAHDFDDLNEKLVDACPDIGSQTRSARSSTSLRSHRVSAVRKSSLRASKAGLHSASRRSQRISVASTRNSSIPSSAGMPDSIIPPVPPMPRPLGIVTSGLPTRHSGSFFASSVTPTSETRAMVHAQDELYAMLGIRMDQEPKSWRLTRTRSMSMSAGPVSAQSRRASTAVTRPLSDSLSPGFHSATGFRSSSP